MITSAERASIRERHIPNTPRTHDSSNRKVDEPVQCREDLTAWPCLTKRLLDALEQAEGGAP